MGGDRHDQLPAPTLGILFVHGMGTHPQGATLRDLGEPLVDWLEKGNVGIDSVKLTTARLTPGDDAAAHVRLELYATGAAKGAPTRTWLLAESCWSQSFKAAAYPRIAFWLIASVPWMIGEYLRGAWHREEDRANAFSALRRRLICVYAFLGALLTGPLIIVLTLLLVVRLIPIEQLQKAVDKLPRLLSASLGDIYVILTTHIDRAAIRDRILSDHRWLQRTCGRTVVVAHSAGTAVTHQLIRDGAMTGLRTYVTFGEAIWRMRWMVVLSQQGAMRITALVLAVGGSLLIAAGAVLLTFRVDLGAGVVAPEVVDAALALAGVGLQLWSSTLVWEIADTATWRNDAIEALRGKVGPWRDYVASADPVPAGSLIDESFASAPSRRRPDVTAADSDRAHYQPIGIHNRRSTILDHVTYPANLEEFIAGIARDLAAEDGLTLAIEQDVLAKAKQARTLRTLSLALLRLASFVVGAVVMLALIFEDALAEADLGLTVHLQGLVPKGLAGHVNEGRVGTLVALLLLVAPWLVAGVVWRSWDGADRSLFRAHDDPRSRHGRVAAVWLACSAAAAAAVLAIAAIDFGWWIATGVALVFGGLLLTMVARVAKKRDKLYE
jgi:hypothetical protein